MKEFSDEEMLSFLLTSEFNEGFSPDEFKFLLGSFRYHYRLLRGKCDRDQVSYDGKIRDKDNDIGVLNSSITKKDIEILALRESLDKIKNRKLTWWERITGKIKFEDENTGV